MTLGESINYYRKRAKLSQEELAARVGVSRQSVSKWELDEATPEIGKLKALAETFGISVDQLLSGEVPPEPEEPAAEEAAAEGTPPPQGQGDGFDRATGLLGKLIRRYGWLAGVYVALSGAGVALVGAIAMFAFSAMGNTAQNMMNSMGPLGGGGYWTVSGGDVPPEILEQIGVQPSPVAQMTSVPVAVATVILVVGVLIAVAGAILAAVLYRKGNRK